MNLQSTDISQGDLPKKDLSNLQDQELFQVAFSIHWTSSLIENYVLQLLEEAYHYKRPKDRQGKSEMFRVSKCETWLSIFLSEQHLFDFGDPIEKGATVNLLTHFSLNKQKLLRITKCTLGSHSTF